MHLSTVVTLLAAAAAASATGHIDAHIKRQEQPDGTPPVNNPLPEVFFCNQERANCPPVGTVLESGLPDTLAYSAPPFGCQQVVCQEFPGGQVAFTLCNDRDVGISVEAEEFRRRVGDVGVLCTDLPASEGGNFDPSDCSGQTFYPDGTNVIVSGVC